MDRQVAVQVLENLEPRAGGVVSQQGVEMFEARSNPARRRSREIQARFVLDLGQLDTESLQPGLDRMKLGSHRERLASSQEADEVARLAFEPEDFRLQLAGAVVVRTRGGAEFGVDRLRQRIDDRWSRRLPELREERAFGGAAVRGPPRP
jgi:hypothetical protein